MRLTFVEVRIDLDGVPLQQGLFRFFAAIMDARSECKRLWAYLRLLDKSGSGCALINIKLAARHLGCSTQTIYRLINLGVAPTATTPTKGDGHRPQAFVNPLRWFGEVHRLGGGWCKIWYSSTVNICSGLGLQGPGAVADVEIDGLGRSGAKLISTELTAIQKQQQAYFACKSSKANRKRKVLKAWEQIPSENSTGVKFLGSKPVKDRTPPVFPRNCDRAAVEQQWNEEPEVYKGVRYLLSRPCSPIAGASIKGIARSTDWTSGTVRRRLDNRYRLDRGASAISKVRIVERAPKLDLWMEHRAQISNVMTLDGVQRPESSYKGAAVVKLIDGNAYILGPNAYAQNYQLSSARYLRKRCSDAYTKPFDLARVERTEISFGVRRALEPHFPVDFKSPHSMAEVAVDEIKGTKYEN
jgi:hypothetical protein